MVQLIAVIAGAFLIIVVVGLMYTYWLGTLALVAGLIVARRKWRGVKLRWSCSASGWCCPCACLPAAGPLNTAPAWCPVLHQDLSSPWSPRRLPRQAVSLSFSSWRVAS